MPNTTRTLILDAGTVVGDVSLTETDILRVPPGLATVEYAHATSAQQEAADADDL